MGAGGEGQGGGGSSRTGRPVLLLHIGLHIAIGEVGLQIRIGLQIAVARQYVPAEPVAAVSTQLGQGIGALQFGPALELRWGCLLEDGLGPFNFPQQQQLAGDQRLEPLLAAGFEPLAGGRNPLRFALGKSGGGQGCAGQKISGGGARRPATEDIDLLLNGEEGADLLEKGLEFLRSHARVSESLQAAAALDQLLQQGKPLGPLGLGREVAAEQVKYPVGAQSIELVFQLLANGRLLAHALQKLQALLQDLGSPFISTLPVQVGGSGKAGQSRQDGEVGIAAIAENGCLGWLQGSAHQLETLQGLARFEQQQQTCHFHAGRDIEGRQHGLAAAGKGRQVRFVGLAPAPIAEQVGTGPEQLFPGPQGVLGQSMLWGAVDPLLQGEQQRLQVAGRADSEQPEMIDRQFQSGPVAGG